MSELANHLKDKRPKIDKLRKAGAYAFLTVSSLVPAGTAFARAEPEPLSTSELGELDYMPEIIGDEQCQIDTKNALNLLATKAHNYYVRVSEYVGVIDCESSGSNMYANENPPRLVVGEGHRQAGLYWYASVIGHDATHSMRYHEYQRLHPESTLVPDNAWAGKEVEDICNDAQVTILNEVGAPQYLIDYLNSIRSTPYWEVPVEERP